MHEDPKKKQTIQPISHMNSSEMRGDDVGFTLFILDPLVSWKRSEASSEDSSPGALDFDQERIGKR